MKRSQASIDARRNEIASLLELRGHMSIAELAHHFSVSALTIRRDLDYLEESKIASRSYGSASLLNPMGRPSGSKQVRANKAIARAAALLVQDGDSIFINTSSTAISMINYIEAEDVTVITNNRKVSLVEVPSSVSVLLTGGELRPRKSSLTGELACANIRSVEATKCFLGCSGLSVVRGLNTATPQETAVNALMLEHSRTHYLLADSSKIGLDTGFAFGTVSEIDMLVTDDRYHADLIESLIEAGMGDVLRVSMEPMLA